MKFIKTLLLVSALSAGLSQTAPAAVTFTNTPAVVSNTYPGVITLQIGGLTNTETVVVQKFLDLNTNGVIDGGDWLVQQFRLTDGTNFVIGGVTNINVPGDLNSATGAITATLNFQGGDFVQNIVGRYLFKLSSPVGHFTPITNLFMVTNFPFAQKFTGNVVSNSTSKTLSNAVVVLFPPPRSGNHGPGTPVAGTVVNSAGSYTIQLPPGTYVPMAFKSNYVANYTLSPVLTLGSGQTINTNLTLTNATASISGKVVDAANNAIVLPGVFMPASSTNGQIVATFTDTNGAFTEQVTSGKWGIGSDDSGLIVHGYVGLSNDTNVLSGSTSVTITYPRATALFYGSVTNSQGPPLAGIDVEAFDNNTNEYQSDGFTDINGNYVVGIVGGLGNNDPWVVQVSNGGGSGNPTNYIYTQPQLDQNGGTNLSVGQVLQVDFTALLATNLITGNVQESSTNIAGVGVFASATINGVTFNVNADTDGNGDYSLNVANGTWSVSVNCNGGSDSLDNILGVGTYQCPASLNVTINNNNVTTNFIIQPCGGVSITTTSPLPVGEVNVPYDQFLQASSCNPSFTWTNTSGSGALPPGLTFGSNGELSGTPTGGGVFNFTARVTDGNNATTNRQFSLSVSNAVQVPTASLPNGTNGLNYSQQLQAINGVPFGGVPYSWSLFSGSLPASLNLATNGLLSGPLTTGGLFNFTVEATDSLGATYNQPLSLTVITTNLPPLSVGTAGGQIIVLWPASAGTNFTLQTSTNVAGPWVPATNGVPQISFTFTNNSPAVFFRLQ